MKIAVIGGGSTYTPELVSGLSRERDRIGVRRARRCTTSTPSGARSSAAWPRGCSSGRASTARSSVTGELDRALDGADFVLVQIRVGGQAARLSDETVPLACGCIGQETTGAGGFAKALRTVPVVLEIAERVRELAAPGRLDRRLHEPGRDRHAVAARRRPPRRRPLQRRDRLPALVRAACSGVEPGEVVVDQVGLNHLTWIRAVQVDGATCCPSCWPRTATRSREQAALPLQLLEELGVVPSTTCATSTRTTRVLAEQLGGVPRAEVVAEIERGLLELYRDPALNEKPALLEQRGGAFYSEAATGLVASLVIGDGVVHEVDIRNDGTLAGLADDDVVEVPARVEDGRLVPLPAGAARARAARARSSTSPPTSGSPRRPR